MSLWARFTAWWEAGKTARQAAAARKQQARTEALLAEASTLGGHDTPFMGGYHGPSGSDCGPGVSGDCVGGH